jgi:hypothetical protein
MQAEKCAEATQIMNEMLEAVESKEFTDCTTTTTSTTTTTTTTSYTTTTPPTTTTLFTCPKQSSPFHCKGTTKCIPKSWKCDGSEDCPGGSVNTVLLSSAEVLLLFEGHAY